ncbi:collagen alpha-2(IV) chain-like, partial [Amphibalanus amphitrite]|uniref:collagen alpha-2(IV) chain-like n=1 Tax=Amphibalanus amphitrite TaxID=1232801 RepID=UPI001C9266E4
FGMPVGGGQFGGGGGPQPSPFTARMASPGYPPASQPPAAQGYPGSQSGYPSTSDGYSTANHQGYPGSQQGAGYPPTDGSQWPGQAGVDSVPAMNGPVLAPSSADVSLVSAGQQQQPQQPQAMGTFQQQQAASLGLSNATGAVPNSSYPGQLPADQVLSGLMVSAQMAAAQTMPGHMLSAQPLPGQLGPGQQSVPTYPPVTGPHQLYQQPQQQHPTSMAGSVRPTGGQGSSISGMLADFSRALGLGGQTDKSVPRSTAPVSAAGYMRPQASYGRPPVSMAAPMAAPADPAAALDPAYGYPSGLTAEQVMYHQQMAAHHQAQHQRKQRLLQHQQPNTAGAARLYQAVPTASLLPGSTVTASAQMKTTTPIVLVANQTPAVMATQMTSHVEPIVRRHPITGDLIYTSPALPLALRSLLPALPEACAMTRPTR